MRINKLAIAGALGLGLSTAANAQNFIYLTGSTAFRSVAFQAITNSFDAVPTIATRDGSATSGNNANYMVFHGNVSGADTWVACHWTGSEDGVASVAAPGSNPEFFLLTDGSVTGISSAKPTSSETNTTPIAPDLCFADNSQQVSLTKTPSLTAMGTNQNRFGTPAGVVGVVPFTWAKNKNLTPCSGWLNLTNLTATTARAAIKSGGVIAALLTGVPTDTTNYVYCVGRNNRSGTRTDTLIATKYGTTTIVKQFGIGGTSSSDGVTLALAAESFNSGYNGGGDVAKALQIDGSCTQADPINAGFTGWLAAGYLGIGDANTARNGGAVWLTYNGIPESNGAIEEGYYDYWNYEYIYGKVGIAGPQADFANNLANIYIQKFALGSNPVGQDTSINLGNMHCVKPSDTGDPVHN
jgi:hypothetical protein